MNVSLYSVGGTAVQHHHLPADLCMWSLHVLRVTVPVSSSSPNTSMLGELLILNECEHVWLSVSLC